MKEKMATYLSIAAFATAILSAVFWGLAATVNFQFGYDMDAELSAAMKKSSRRNAGGALFAAASVLCQGASAVLASSCNC